MDFGTLLHVAKKNSEVGNNGSKYYNTKYEPPKKESKEKRLSANIQKFLQKREQEEKERQRADKEKLDKLLAMRDEKSKNKIKKMLKVTKSANKSVLDDALDSERGGVNMEAPDQVDQDDYGYVSTTANAFYQKYIEKVKDVKDDKGFAPSRPQSLKDLSGTKERVKAAITREYEDKKTSSRQRSSTASTSTSSQPSNKSSSRSATLYDPEAEKREEERKKRDEEQKRAKNRKPPPPPLDFQALLKLAEKKQHEPVDIMPTIKKKEPERLLTSKEKRELEERKQAKETRDRARGTKNSASKDRKERERESGKTTNAERSSFSIPKLGQSSKLAPASNATSKPTKTSNSAPSSNKVANNSNNAIKSNANTSISSSSKSVNMETKKVLHSIPRPNINSAPKSSLSSSVTAKSSSSRTSSSASVMNSKNVTSKNPYNGPTRDFPPRDIKSVKSKQLPKSEIQKTRQFPPADLRRSGNNRVGDNRKPPPQKRRILDDSDEDEYDSEMDDFIDDGDCEMDYSAHIKQIFGYDKSRYRDIDEEDDAAMESNFAQVQREEFISKKIGLQEDLEDMKLEAMEKKRKMMKKKRLNN